MTYQLLSLGGSKTGGTTRRFVSVRPITDRTRRAAQHLADRGFIVRLAAGRVSVDGMALTYAQAKALARREGWLRG